MNESLTEQFSRFQGELEQELTEKRECAEYSHPTELPPAYWTPSTTLVRPINSTPAHAATTLVTNLVNASVPTNGSPIFTIQSTLDPTLPLEAVSVVREFETGVRNEIMRLIVASNFRSALYGIYRALVVVGDVLVEQVNERTFVYHRLDNYICHRNKEGKVHRLLVREWVDPSTLPQKYQNVHGGNGTTLGVRRLEAVFTDILWNEDAKLWKTRKEFRGQTMETGEITVLNYYPVRSRTIAGSNVGMSILQDIIGTLRGLMASEMALIEGLAANSEFRLGVNPNGVTRLTEMEDSVNGQWVSARQEDVFALQLGSPVQVQASAGAVEKYERMVKNALAYGRAYADTRRDRVTAAEVQVDAREAEGGVSGILTNIGDELLIPMIKRYLFLLASKQPQNITLQTLVKAILEERMDVSLNAGIAALNLEIRGLRLAEAFGTLVRLPEPAWAGVKWDVLAEELLTAAGFVGSQFLKTAAEKAAEQNAAIQQQAASTAANSAADSMGQSVMDTQAIPPQQIQ